MKIKRIAAAIAVVGVGALILSGCSAPKSEIVENTSLSIAQNSAVTSLNANVSSQYSTYNSNIQYLTQGQFNYYNAKPTLVKNTKFGTYTVVSKSPLTVKYTVNPGVKWSDGTPVGASDMLLFWASSLTKYNNPKGPVNFDSIDTGSGLDLVTQVPKISDDNRSVTLVFSKVFVDWEVLFAFNGIGVPAHVTYQEAYPDKKISNTDAQAAVVKAIQTNDTPVLAKIAKAWGNAYNVVSMPSDKKLLVSSGPYVVSAFVKDQYITLTANKNYTWGPLPKVQKITVRFIDDPLAQVQALENGEVDIVSGQATADTIKALQGIKSVNSSNTNESSYEHVDLSFNNKGPFDPATYGGDATKAHEVRQAFLDTIPRQEIVDKLIKPLNPKVQLDDSQIFLPGAPGYTESVANNGSSSYASVNIAEAKSLLAKAGVSNLTVKFGYPNDNPRRVNEFALIKASAAEAGITLTDDGMPSTTYFSLFGAGSTWDANIYASQYTNLGVSQPQGTFQTAAGGNYNGYSNKSVDDDFAKLTQSLSLTTSQQQSYLASVDKSVWNDAYGVTLYQLPDISAWSKKVTNVQDAPLSPNVFWNYFEWDVKK